jgi:hypothetical protein
LVWRFGKTTLQMQVRSVDENGEPKVKWRGDNNPKNVFDYINYGGQGVYYFRN